MTPREYEELVSEHLRNLGYITKTTPYSNDYGVDVFAVKGNERIAVQAKMFGDTARKINRQMVMELHGAKDYFDCTKAVIITDGVLIDNALEVACKLGIEVIHLPAQRRNASQPLLSQSSSSSLDFDQIWQQYIMPLQGKVLQRDNGKTNTILRVDWAGIERITSSGNRQTIQIEIFQKAVNHILQHGFIARTAINEEYAKRASSGVVLILSQVPMFELIVKPQGLRLRKQAE